MEKVILFGNSAWSELTHYYFTHDSDFRVEAFTIDGSYIKENSFCGLPVVPFEEVEKIYSPEKFKMFTAVLARKVNKLRAEKYYQAKAKGYGFVTYISSKASKWENVVIGENSFLGEGTVVRPFVKVGDNVAVLGGVNLGHHTVVQNHCFIAAGVTTLGATVIGEYTILGANSTILDAVSIAPECIIGAGCVISKSTSAREVYRHQHPELLNLSSDQFANLLFRRTMR